MQSYPLQDKIFLISWMRGQKYFSPPFSEVNGTAVRDSRFNFFKFDGATVPPSGKSRYR